MAIRSRRLSLSRETMRVLASEALGRAVGGYIRDETSDNGNSRCNTCGATCNATCSTCQGASCPLVSCHCNDCTC